LLTAEIKRLMQEIRSGTAPPGSPDRLQQLEDELPEAQAALDRCLGTPAVQCVRVFGFDPTINGLHFLNSFPTGIPDYTLNLLGVAVKLGDASNGLCGGFVYTVMDCFNAGLLPPPLDDVPGAGSPLFNYLVARLTNSFDEDDVNQYLSWIQMSDGDGLLGNGISTHEINEEWPKIKADLDSNKLSPLGLVSGHEPPAVGFLTGFQDLGNCHQVLAWGYDLDEAQLTIHIYDPDYYGKTNTIVLYLNHVGAKTPITVSNWKENTYRGFFRTHYTFNDPRTPTSAAFIVTVVTSPGIQTGGPVPRPLAPGEAFVLPDAGPGFFTTGSDGHLWANYWDQPTEKWLWIDHGTPPDTVLSGVPGALLNSVDAGLKFFVRTVTGSLFERYWNSVSRSWGWTDHGRPRADVQVFSDAGAVFDQTIPGITFFLGCSDGHLWQNYWNQRSQQWLWTDHGAPPGTVVAGTPGARFNSADAGMKVFVRGANGHLMERYWNPQTQLWEWTDHGTPKSNVNVVIDPNAALDSSGTGIKLFMGGSDGHLWERYWKTSAQEWLWSDHGAPPGTSIAGAPGALLDSGTAGLKFFVRGQNGHLFERYWNQARTIWEWMDHGVPGVQIVTDPGGVLDSTGTGIKFFTGGSDRHVWEHYWNQQTQQWLWTDHGLK
jgi:hypothetical protein